MNRVRFYLFIVAHLVAALHPCQSQFVQLDLLSAISMALEENKNLKQEINKGAMKIAELDQTKANYLPSVNVNSSVFRSSGRTFDETTGSLRTETGEFARLFLNSSLTLYNGFYNSHVYGQKQLEAEAQDSQIEFIRQNLILNVADLYMTILLNEYKLKVTEKHLFLQQEIFDQIQNLVELGLKSPIDLMAQQAEVERVRMMDIQSQGEYQQSVNELLVLLSTPDIDSIYLEPVEFLEHFLLPTREDHYFQTALEERPEFNRVIALQNASKKDWQSRKTKVRPRLDAYLNYGTRYSSFQDREFDKQVTNDNISTEFGLRLFIPIFNNLSGHINIQRSKVNCENLRLERELLEQRIKGEVQNATNAYQVARQSHRFADIQHQSARQYAELERERYRLGESTILELSIANRNEFEARINVIQTKFQVYYNKLNILYQLGLLSSELN